MRGKLFLSAITSSTKSIMYLSGVLAIIVSFQNCSPVGEKSNLWIGEEGLLSVGEAGNTPPTISMTSPLGGIVLVAPATINIAADATDEDGTVQKVEFYVDGILVNEDVTAPFSYEHELEMEGSYSLYAKAFDDNGGIVGTETLVVTAEAPVVDLINPACLPENGYFPPSITIPPATKTLSVDIGMRPFAPASVEGQYDVRHPYSITTAPGVAPDADCNGRGDIDANCNNTGIRVQPDDDVECSTGSATITVTVDDACGGSTNADVIVNHTNVCQPEQWLPASDPQTQAAFGSRVAINNNYAVVSAPGRGGNSKVGAAYVYQNNSGTWSEKAILAPSSAAYTEINAVAIRGDLIAIASRATSLNGHTGKVFVYQGSGSSWSLLHTITGPTPTQNPNDVTRFGAQLVIAPDDSIIVGADTEDWANNSLGGPDAGAAYVYTRSSNSWNQSQRLTASNAVAYHNFGQGLAIEGGLLVVGAPKKASAESASSHGSAYVFAKSGGSWAETHILNPDQMEGSSMQFAADVATDGSNVLVGAKNANGNRGRAYLFKSSGANFSRIKLQAPDRVARDYYGRSVAIGNGKAYVGAPGSRHDGAEIGATFQHELNDGSVSFKLIPRAGNRDSEQNAASDIGVSGTTLIMGSESRDSDNKNNSGATYFIKLD